MSTKSLGTLSLSLVAKISGFEEGMTRAERISRQKAKETEKAWNDAVKGVGAATVGIATAVSAAVATIANQARSIADFQDVGDKIGDLASEVATLQRAAALSETGFDTITAASVRLTAALSKQDEESAGAAQALKNLGLNFEEFKKLGPVAQIDAIAKAMAGFSDGTAKTANAVALLGKSGAELLPLLKDLAEGGERQITLTERQIAEADKFAKSLDSLSVEMKLFGQQAASPVIEAMNAIIERFKAGQKEGESFFAFFAKFGTPQGLFKAGINALTGEGNDPRGNYSAIRKELDSVNRSLKSGNLLESQRLALVAREAKLQKEVGSFLTGSRLGMNDPRSLGLPTLDADFTKPDKTGGGATRAVVSEAERYLESLKQQLQATQDLTVAEKLLADIQAGRLGTVGSAMEKELLGIAKQIDASTAAKKLADDVLRTRERTADMQRQADDAALSAVQQVIDGNQALRDQIEVLGLEGEALAAVEQQRLAATIAEKELTLASLQNAEASHTQIESLEREIRLLKERSELIGEKSLRETNLKAAADAAAKLAKEAEEARKWSDDLALSLTSGFEEAVIGGKKLSDVFKGLEQDIIRMTTKTLVTKPLSNWLGDFLNGSFGKSAPTTGDFSRMDRGQTGGGGGIADIFGGILGKLFSFDGGGYTGNGPRSGGMDGKGGFLAMVHPSETIVDHTKGDSGRSSVTIHQNFNISGPVDARTRSQIAAEAAAGAQRALARNG